MCASYLRHSDYFEYLDVTGRPGPVLRAWACWDPVVRPGKLVRPAGLRGSTAGNSFVGGQGSQSDSACNYYVTN